MDIIFGKLEIRRIRSDVVKSLRAKHIAKNGVGPVEALASIKNEICLVKMIIYLNFPGLTPGFQIV